MSPVTLQGTEKETETGRAGDTDTSVIILSYGTTNALGSVACKL